MSNPLDGLPPPVPFTGLPALRCLFPGKDLKLAINQGPVLPLTLDGQIFLLAAASCDRADSCSVERLYQAGLDLLALYADDREVFARCGFGPAWEEAFRKVLGALYETWRGRQADAFRIEAERHFQGGAVDEAEGLVRRVHKLAQAAQLPGVFTYLSADRASFEGLRTAVWEIITKSKTDPVRGRILGSGVTEPMLARLGELYGELNRLQEVRSREAAAVQNAQKPLRLLKGMVFAELGLVTTAGRSELSPDRAERYLLTRLLDLPRASDRRDPPQPPGPQPEPGPTPAGPTPPIDAGGTAPRPAPPLPASPLPSGAPLAGSAPGGSSAAPALVPGTILSRIDARGGPPLVAVVQADGGVAWIPVPDPAPVADAPAPIPPVPPAKEPPSRRTPRSRR